MNEPTKHARRSAESQDKLILAAQRLILRQGYSATTVDQICAEAGLTKGAFFHHYANKEAIGRAAVDAWGAMGTRLYAQAWADPTMDPLAQLHRMLDIMVSFTTGRDEPCVCVVGMMSQELALANPELRAACARHLDDWTQHVVRLLAAAKAKHRPAVDFDPEAVAWMLNSIWQGSMLIAKTRQAPAMLVANVELARAYVAGLFPAVPPPTPASATGARRATSTAKPRKSA